ncbi:hypothetical protein GCM10007096_14540 [Pullulanibacillus pueri]|uniref:Uncharacterized protein n=1 Tax=Pullulanibacillus pueri TaxID=1437324 RepID=A0A8J2ZUY7_9BACL|nr:hypothetical protein GCM10007096_14540 [Pullulanibacillus pueri]
MFGDGIGKALKGNCQSGDARVALRENLLDLSRSVYSLNDHLIYIVCRFGVEKLIRLRLIYRSHLNGVICIAVITLVLAAIFSNSLECEMK